MSKSLRTGHDQISRQIRAVERAVLAFQSGMIKSAGCSAGVDTNTAIILCARLSTVWKRVGAMIPSGKQGGGALPNASFLPAAVTTKRTEGKRNSEGKEIRRSGRVDP